MEMITVIYLNKEEGLFYSKDILYNDSLFFLFNTRKYAAGTDSKSASISTTGFNKEKIIKTVE